MRNLLQAFSWPRRYLKKRTGARSLALAERALKSRELSTAERLLSIVLDNDHAAPTVRGTARLSLVQLYLDQANPDAAEHTLEYNGLVSDVIFEPFCTLPLRARAAALRGRHEGENGAKSKFRQAIDEADCWGDPEGTDLYSIGYQYLTYLVGRGNNDELSDETDALTNRLVARDVYGEIEPCLFHMKCVALSRKEHYRELTGLRPKLDELTRIHGEDHEPVTMSILLIDIAEYELKRAANRETSLLDTGEKSRSDSINENCHEAD